MWKTILGRCIYGSTSQVKVYQNLLFRWLTFDSDALQTVIHRKQPQKPVLKYLPVLCMLARSSPGDTCLLGLGGAGAAHYLSSFNPAYQLIAVEKSPEIIAIAQKYFMSSDIKNLQVIQQNATEFIQKNTSLFKHLLIDLYDAHYFPAECNTDSFFLNCKRNLEKHGFLAVNLANPAEQFLLLRRIAKHFKHTVTVPVKGSANTVILACNSHSFSAIVKYLHQAATIKRLEWDAVWGHIADIKFP